MNIALISFWSGFFDDNDCFNKVILNIGINKNEINLVSYDQSDFIIVGSFVSDEDLEILLKYNKKKILYITEPIEHFNLLTYKLFSGNFFDIVYGCIDNNINKRYYKFPLYVFCVNIYEINYEYFQKINEKVCCDDITKKNFACLINIHDQKNTRTPIYKLLTRKYHIDCPSKLFNNCDNKELNELGNVEYISQYLFNICSENSICKIDGYITEKIMNCCLGGAIPIYCGWFSDIDAKIFNKNRIIFYDPYDDTSLHNALEKINALMNTNEIIDFYKQPVFCESAYETIKEMHDIIKRNLFHN